jgi:para-aminobenzoate synthetase/4-amino-4-deoxychorismate lyase
LERMSAQTGCDEVLFANERGELTEGTRTNVFVRRGERLFTPPISCGLLDGTLRQEIISCFRNKVTETVLHRSDLAIADEVLLGNSVRGLMSALPVESAS